MMKRLNFYFLNPAAAKFGNFAPVIGIAGRLVVGGIFIYSGYIKAVSPVEEFAAAIESYRIVPGWFAMLSAHLVPWLELYLGCFLALGLATRMSALAIGGMLFVFETALLSVLARGIALADCGCFGPGLGHSIVHAVILDVFLLVLTAGAFVCGNAFYNADSWVWNNKNAEE